MKRSYLKIAALALLVTFSNCSKDEAEPVNVTPPVEVIPEITDTQLATDLNSDLEIDLASELGFSIQQKVETATIKAKSSSALKALAVEISACNITREIEKDLVDFEGKKYFSYVYDFGTTGCTQPNGNTVKGIIKVLSLTSNFKDIVVLFQNYNTNERIVNGSVALTKSDSNTVPSIKTTQNLTVTLPKLGEFKRTGTITRTYIKGYDTPDVLNDDFFKTSGDWTTTFPNNTKNTVKITKDLLTSTECKKHIQGTLSFVRNLNVGTIDFGDGIGCTQTVKITRNGKEFVVEVK